MMSLSEIFFLAIVLYVLYRFVFNFVVPIARTTRQVRQQFRNMQEMHERQDPYQGQGGQAQPKKPSSGNKAGEYIDFEEIK